MKKIILAVDGMTCSACSNGLEKYLNKQEGISNASVNLVLSNAMVEYDEKFVNIEKIEEYIKKAGFQSLGIFKEIKIEKISEKEKYKFVLFTILAILLMYISMGHMINLSSVNIIDVHNNPENYGIVQVVLASLFIIYGLDIIKNGYKNLVHGTANMDTLVSIGVISSFLYSLFGVYMIFQGEHDYTMNLYFESVAIIIYFVKLGRYIDRISKDKTKEAISSLVKITPLDAVIKINNSEKRVTIDEIKKGDIIISKPGERIAVDGEIIIGKAHLDESFITGESVPVSKSEGQKVVAGSINYDGYLEYKAERIGKDSTISEIVRLVVEATNTKAPIAKLADKVSSYLIPIVMILAVVTFVIYLILGYEFSIALTTFITILVVVCPCSLGLAAPLSIVVAEGLCANSGILVKKSEVLENAGKVDTVVFDKTGTITYGTLRIAEVINYSNIGNDRLLQLAGSLESKSTHPIGKAFTDYLNDNNISLLEVDDFEEISGYGIVGNVNKKRILLGNSKLLKKYSVKNKYIEDEKELSKKGNSVIYVVENNEVIALIGVSDIVRDDAKDVIGTFYKMGIDIIMLTGDNLNTANKIAKELGIKRVVANVLPIEKVDVIRKFKNENKYVMMCGDGINDSPSLAVADIGVSVNSGTDIAMNSSDVILSRNNLTGIINLINISKNTLKNIKQNLFWAFFYNLLMIPIAMGLLKPIGISINPMIASVAMVFSSITVIVNALRLRRLKIK